MTASQYKMISIPEAQATVLQHTKPLGTEQVQLADALGRTLAAAVIANEPLPPFPASIKASLMQEKPSANSSRLGAPGAKPLTSLMPFQDGYAVVSSDGPGEYPVVGEARTGDIGDLKLNPGQVVYITTGTL